eukprot:TRINITY_DN6512_c0_g1_i1.p2 TRINITY_DN6512_c0_g1~~TRINITY_DN6512_c0_g1_i1.p2  ORF type:complete len:302 (+),score=141.78 TRINITY_DN6512_c0_g1_i1:51-956(+)
MKTALSLLALAATAAAQEKAINVNFNACSGGSSGGAAAASAPNKEQVAPGCNVKKLVRYVEADFPPYDDLDEATQTMKGLVVELFDQMCSATDALADVKCYEVRDSWGKIWTKDHYPGEGLVEGRYDFALAFVNSLRAQSLAYSHHLFDRLKSHFVALASTRPETEMFPDMGENETIGLICGWGENQAVQQQFSKATFPPCAIDSAAQFKMLEDGTASVIWVGEAEWLTVVDDEMYTTVGPKQDLLEQAGDHHVDAIAFMFAKDNECALEKVNKALEEVMASSWWTTFCGDENPLLTCKGM